MDQMHAAEFHRIPPKSDNNSNLKIFITTGTTETSCLHLKSADKHGQCIPPVWVDIWVSVLQEQKLQ